MVKEGRAQYADPCSMIRAASMLMRHAGYVDKANKLDMALDVCGNYEKKLVLTGRSDGATGRAYCEYLMETMEDPGLEQKWKKYQMA
jgi:isocitrate/isopropylmalate dehydrogenase